MFRKYSDSNKLYCFSPPVMLATFMIEFMMAIYAFWRYKMNLTGKLAVTILFSLGAFQLSEYMICGGLGWTHIDWVRFGYVAITLLPALGIHMISSIAGKKMPALVSAAYLSCAAFVAFYVFNTASVAHEVCYANYAVFSTSHNVSQWFGLYYYAWLFIGIYLSWHLSNNNKDKKIALRGMAAGYLVFILPTGFVNVANPATIAGIPSIMCGFAVLFALILVFKVLPNTCAVKNSLELLLSKVRLKN